MKDFDLTKIGREMPYKAPNNQFFEDFTEDLLAKVSPKPRRVFSLKTAMAPLAGIAAAIAIVFIFANNTQEVVQWSDSYALNDTLDESLDAFLSGLSDAELEYLAAESSYNNDFYANLPTNN